MIMSCLAYIKRSRTWRISQSRHRWEICVPHLEAHSFKLEYQFLGCYVTYRVLIVDADWRDGDEDVGRATQCLGAGRAACG